MNSSQRRRDFAAYGRGGSAEAQVDTGVLRPGARFMRNGRYLGADLWIGDLVWLSFGVYRDWRAS